MKDVITPREPFDWHRVRGVALGLLRRLLRVRLLWVIGGVVLALYILSASCSTYVPPNMVGVRQVYYGKDAGIRPDVYGPGLHFIVAGAERLHMFPHDTQVVNFSDSPSEGAERFRAAPSIKIQTSDGYNVQLDVTVLYRIEDPYKVFVEAGPGRTFEDRLVVPRADRILRKTLGELNSEQFYQGPLRIQKAQAAHDQLRDEVLPSGIRIDAVLVRGYVYDEKYQQLIEGRKIKDQTVFLRQAEAKAAIEQRKRDTIVAEGKAAVETELQRGRAEVEKLRAQADLYQRKRAAEGKLLVELADAKGTGLENAALQGAGSENLVGLKMADALRGVRVIVLPSDGKDGTNPLDLGELLRKFQVR
ncbi:MAG TPA: SPFH domain-containing protein [Polyangia bacterium]|nr:SPFH domain-containing protein [Polyangia bacterium]